MEEKEKSKMSTDEAVKVAVRVRPFNKREIARYAQILFPPEIFKCKHTFVYHYNPVENTKILVLFSSFYIILLGMPR